MAQRSREQMYEASGLTDAQRDAVIWQLRQRRHSYAKIARAVGVSVGAVRASLGRTAAKLRGPGSLGSDDWDADLR
jgi:DNA-directed RNA polymerase specialized sigma24 family protein